MLGAREADVFDSQIVYRGKALWKGVFLRCWTCMS